jgi:hypothetical protein
LDARFFLSAFHRRPAASSRKLRGKSHRSTTRTIEALWVWSGAQIAGAFSMSWGSLPAWKIVIGLVVMAALAAILVVMFIRGLRAFGRIAAAFWTMAVTVCGILSFVVVAGLFSRGFQWVAASVPDDFWEKLL